MGRMWQWFSKLPARLAEGLIVDLLKPAFTPVPAMMIAGVTYFSAPERWKLWGPLLTAAVCFGVVNMLRKVLASRNHDQAVAAGVRRIPKVLSSGERHGPRILSLSLKTDPNSIAEVRIEMGETEVVIEVTEQPQRPAFGKRGSENRAPVKAKAKEEKKEAPSLVAYPRQRPAR